MNFIEHLIVIFALPKYNPHTRRKGLKSCLFT